MTLIFTYGTLMKGCSNHRLLEHSSFVGKAISEPVFTMLHLGGFPGIIRSGETAITGEVYEVDTATLKRLDRLEGHPSFYERQSLTATLEDGPIVDVEGYVLPDDWLGRAGTIVANGIWRER